MGQPASRDSPLDYRTLGVPGWLGREDFPAPECQTPAHDLPRPAPVRDHDIASKIGTAFRAGTVRRPLVSPDLSCVFAALDGDAWYGRALDCRAAPTRSGTGLGVRYTVREEHGRTWYPVPGTPSRAGAQVPPLPLPITLNLHQRGAPGLVSRRLFCLLPLLALSCEPASLLLFSPCPHPSTPAVHPPCFPLVVSPASTESASCGLERHAHTPYEKHI